MSMIQLPGSFFYGAVATKPSGGDSMLIDKNNGNVTFFRGGLMLHIDCPEGPATISTEVGRLDLASAVGLADGIAQAFDLIARIGRSAGPCFRFELIGAPPQSGAERSLI